MACRKIALAALTLCCGTASAQWLKLPTPGIPRTPDGKPNLTAPAPRTTDGRPDLSGLWKKVGDKFDNNIAADLKNVEVAAWADALYQKRKRDFGKDSPGTLCQPLGPEYTVSPYFESRILQTPALISMLNSDLTHREIFMDGRALESDPNPTWMGYSIGRWDGDTLIVESNGYNDKTWLDADGHPHTEDLRITERYQRRDFGHMELQATFTDPKVFTSPVVVRMPMELVVDTEMLEFVCDNEKDHAHMSSGSQQEVKIAPEVLARYVGVYDVTEGGKTYPLEITFSGNTLYYEWNHEGKQSLSALDQNQFSLAGTLMDFILEASGTQAAGGNLEATGPATGIRISTVEGEDKGVRRK